MIKNTLFAFSLVVFLCCPQAFGAPKGKVEEVEAPKKELPKSGVLSRSGKQGYGNTKVEGPFGAEDVFSGSSPISGSVSRISDRQWQLKVFNNSKESTYSVNVEVAQYGERGNKVGSDHYSYTLPPSKGTERSISTGSSVKDCQLNLTNWKEIGKKEKEKEGKAGGAGKPPVSADAEEG